jgi:glycosyltransferase involved in cell wall biosynthesis
MMPRLSIGVVLCTYNGEAYLQAQLQSIAQQNRKPDFLLVCDDGSQDRTNELIKAFATSAAFPVSLVHNEVNLGYVRNFEDGISRCDTDIIVLCDQDDSWRADKLEVLAEKFEADPKVGAVFSDAAIVDENLGERGYTLLDAVNVSEAERLAASSGRVFPVLLRHNIVCGATLAMRATWKARMLPFPEGAIHDEWISLITSAYGALRFVPDTLIQYRQHGANQLGLHGTSWRQRLSHSVHRRENERCLRVMQALHQRLLQLGAPEAVVAAVVEKSGHVEQRLHLPRDPVTRAAAIAREVRSGRYGRYSSGLLSAVRDLLLPM